MPESGILKNNIKEIISFCFDSVRGSMVIKNTPLGILLIGLFFSLFGISSLLAGFAYFFIPSWLGQFGPYFGICLLIAGIIETIFGIGCLIAWSWVWIMGVVILIFGILVQVANLLSMMRYYSLDLTINFWDFFLLGLTGVILYYFIQPEIKEYFGRV